MPKSESYQIRRTYEDVLSNQIKFGELVYKKMTDNDFIDKGRENDYAKLISRAFLSQGNWRSVYYKDDERNVMIPLGPFHSFCLRLGRIRTNKIKLKRFDYERLVDISELWKIVYDELIYVFPNAQEEALKISSEQTYRDEIEPFELTGDKIE